MTTALPGVEAPRAAAPAMPAAGQGRSARAALSLLVSAQFVVMLDTSIVNVALPSLQRDLGLSATGLAWVVNAYFLAFGGMLLVSGRVADMLGRRRMFLLGSAGFGVATLVAGLAADEGVLIAARAAQGVAAAALSPAAMSLLLVRFPGPARAKAMSAWGAASTLGGASGVLAGGLVTGMLGWSWVFFLTVPVSVAALVAGPRLLPADPPRARHRPFDSAGAGAITGAALALIWAALSAPEHGWVGAPTLLASALAVALFALFLRVERRAVDPLVPLELFRSPVVSIGVGLGLLGGAARASTFVLIALHLQQVLRLEPAMAGLAMVPTSLVGFVVSVALLPRVLRAAGPEQTLTAGLVILAGGQIWLAISSPDVGYAGSVLPALFLVATGVALSFTPSTMVLASGLPTERAGLASGLSSASTQVGAALGISAFMAVAAAQADGSGLTGVAAAAVASRGAFGAAAVAALSAAALGAILVRRGRLRA